MTTTDKVYTGDSTTSGSSYTWTYNPSRQAEKGWECPRCGRINAPWISHCDCSRDTWTIDCTAGNTSAQPQWWKSAPVIKGSSNLKVTLDAEADNVLNNPVTYTHVGDTFTCNTPQSYTTSSATTQQNPNSVTTAWNCTNPNQCHTPHYTTETVVNDGMHNFYNLKTPKETK